MLRALQAAAAADDHRCFLHIELGRSLGFDRDHLDLAVGGSCARADRRTAALGRGERVDARGGDKDRCAAGQRRDRLARHPRTRAHQVRTIRAQSRDVRQQRAIQVGCHARSNVLAGGRGRREERAAASFLDNRRQVLGERIGAVCAAARQHDGLVRSELRRACRRDVSGDDRDGLAAAALRST